MTISFLSSFDAATTILLFMAKVNKLYSCNLEGGVHNGLKWSKKLQFKEATQWTEKIVL